MKDKKVSVVSVKNTTMAIVETDESEYCEYIRYSADNWNVRMGESIEQLYEPENLELAYQEFLENNKQCPYCQQSVKLLHKHQTAYGIPETHFPGTEHFTCPRCNSILTRDEAVNSGCVYVLDVEEK